MKQLPLLLITLSLFSFLQLHTQEWAPIGAEWQYLYNASGLGLDRYTVIHIDKDTVIAGQECRKYTVYDQPAGTDTNLFNHIGYTFERNDSIFYWHQDTFLLRYDFSANIGDTITIPTPGFSDWPTDVDSFRVVLDSISTIYYGYGIPGFPLEKYHTSFIDGSFNYDGNGYSRLVGNRFVWGGLFYSGDLPIPGSPIAWLRCYQDADHEIFRIDTDFSCGFPSATRELIAKDQLKLHPNPVDDLLQLHYNTSLSGAKFRLLNQLGEVLMDGYLPKITTEYQLNIHPLPKGFLYLEVRSGQRVGVWKVVKM